MSKEKRKKKGGVRKDKKLERMRADLEERHAKAKPKGEVHDQKDVVPYKQGSRKDKNMDPTVRRSR